jgi:hypothetical protein
MLSVSFDFTASKSRLYAAVGLSLPASQFGTAAVFELVPVVPPHADKIAARTAKQKLAR